MIGHGVALIQVVAAFENHVGDRLPAVLGPAHGTGLDFRQLQPLVSAGARSSDDGARLIRQNLRFPVDPPPSRCVVASDQPVPGPKFRRAHVAEVADPTTPT